MFFFEIRCIEDHVFLEVLAILTRSELTTIRNNRSYMYILVKFRFDQRNQFVTTQSMKKVVAALLISFRIGLEKREVNATGTRSYSCLYSLQNRQISGVENESRYMSAEPDHEGKMRVFRLALRAHVSRFLLFVTNPPLLHAGLLKSLS